MSFDLIPLWGIFLLTMGLMLVSMEVGIQLGRLRLRSGKGKLDVSGAMVGASMGLLSFLLAFTFNAANGRHDARRALVVDETNAIETSWLRAGLLPDPAGTAMRGLLRDYVDVRVKTVLGGMPLAEGLRDTDALHRRMWQLAEQAGRQNPGSIMTGLVIQSLNEVIDLHLKRLTLGLRNRVQPTIWATLYTLLVAGMIMFGIQIGQGAVRQRVFEITVAVTFSLVLLLITDLDRPQEGLLTVSQQAMQELQTKLHAQ